MKLLYCKNCGDVFSLSDEMKNCTCGSTGGKYLNRLNAIYHGEGIPIGFANITFLGALYNQPKTGRGSEFTAFVIPKECDTIKKLTIDEVMELLK